MKTYTDGRLLFLDNADFSNLSETVTVPVIDGWDWTISGNGKGFLTSPDGKEHCRFDLMSSTLAFEPDGEPFSAPGLSAQLVQEMGEKYAYELVFSEPEKKSYDEHVKTRDNTRKIHNRSVYESLRGVIQMEHKNGAWLSYVDTDRVKELTGIESEHVLSTQNGYALFNRMAEKLHASPLHDPSGYMALKGNMYEFIHTEYRNQYENMLQAIDNQMVDGSGYSVEAVLNNLQATVRKNITQNCLPDGEFFGNLRFVKATDERKDAVRNFVKCRVSKTLTYEKKRSYEPAAIERTNKKYEEAAERLKESLTDTGKAAAMEV